MAISSRKVSWVFEADLKDFFGSIDHGWVLHFLKLRAGDPRIISLIERWLKAGVMEGGVITKSEKGTPQGGPISVLISNLYLHYALDLWIEKVVKPRLKGEVYYVRYIDDFVLCFQYRSDALSFDRVLPRRLSEIPQIHWTNMTERHNPRSEEHSRESKGKKVRSLQFRI